MKKTIRRLLAWPYVGHLIGVVVMAIAALLVSARRWRVAREHDRKLDEYRDAMDRKIDATHEAEAARARQDMLARQHAENRVAIARDDARRARLERERLRAEIDRADSPQAVADQLNRLLGL